MSRHVSEAFRVPWLASGTMANAVEGAEHATCLDHDFRKSMRCGRHDVWKRPQGPLPASPCPSGRSAAGAQGLDVHLDRRLGHLRHDRPAAPSAGRHAFQQADQKEWSARGRCLHAHSGRPRSTFNPVSVDSGSMAGRPQVLSMSTKRPRPGLRSMPCITSQTW